FTSGCSPRRVAGTQLLSVVWREAPPGRDSHPPVHVRSQSHERGIYAASTRLVTQVVRYFRLLAGGRTLKRHKCRAPPALTDAIPPRPDWIFEKRGENGMLAAITAKERA